MKNVIGQYRRDINTLRELKREMYIRAVDIFCPDEDSPTRVSDFQDLFRGFAPFMIRQSIDQQNSIVEPEEKNIENLSGPWREICTWLTCSYWRVGTDQRDTVININPHNIKKLLSHDKISGVHIEKNSYQQRLFKRTVAVWGIYYFLNSIIDREWGVSTINKFLAVQSRYKYPLQMSFNSELEIAKSIASLKLVIASDFIERVKEILKPVFDECFTKAYQTESGIEDIVFCSREINVRETSIPNAKDIKDAYLRSFTIMTDEFSQEIERWQEEVYDEWGTPVNKEQAFALVVPMLIYNWYFATPYFYSFPVSLTSKRASILSIATQLPLYDWEVEGFQMMATRVFGMALIRDHISRSAHEQLNTSLYNYTRMVGHNFSKLFTMPFDTQLSKIESALKSVRYVGLRKNMEPRLQVMRILLGHYDSIFSTLLGRVGLKQLFQNIPVILKDFQKDVVPTINVVFSYLREDRLERDLKYGRFLPSLDNNLKIELHIASHKLQFRAPYAYILEIIFNVLHNAISQINSCDVERDPTRATIHLHASKYILKQSSGAKAFLRLIVADGGVGFDFATLNHLNEFLQNIRTSNEDTLWRLADSEVSISKAHEEHLGLGILFSATFLRSLEWHPEVKEGGWIEIDSIKGKGSTITLNIPGLII